MFKKSLGLAAGLDAVLRPSTAALAGPKQNLRKASVDPADGAACE